MKKFISKVIPAFIMALVFISTLTSCHGVCPDKKKTSVFLCGRQRHTWRISFSIRNDWLQRVASYWRRFNSLLQSVSRHVWGYSRWCMISFIRTARIIQIALITSMLLLERREQSFTPSTFLWIHGLLRTGKSQSIVPFLKQVIRSCCGCWWIVY